MQRALVASKRTIQSQQPVPYCAVTPAGQEVLIVHAVLTAQVFDSSTRMTLSQHATSVALSTTADQACEADPRSALPAAPVIPPELKGIMYFWDRKRSLSHFVIKVCMGLSETKD